MTTPQWLTLAIVLCAIVLFASEKVRIDIVALIVVVLLVVLDLITPAQALAGFSNEATVTVAAMFALSLGIERSGAHPCPSTSTSPIWTSPFPSRLPPRPA